MSPGKEVWAVVSDLHCGSTLGLCPPEGAVLDDGGRHTPSRAQRKVWDAWLDYWDIVKQRATGHKLNVVLNGDLVDGDHHKTATIVSRNIQATQHALAMDCLLPMLALGPDTIVVVRGTEAHVGKSAESEEAIGRELEALVCQETEACSWWHFQAETGGCLLDFAHHGRMGQRPWTKMTGPSTLAAQIVMAAATDGTRCPDVAVRSHYHQWADTIDNFGCRVIGLAGWQLATPYVHRIAAGSIPHIGGLIITCEKGHAEVEKVKYRMKRSRPWRSGN